MRKPRADVGQSIAPIMTTRLAPPRSPGKMVARKRLLAQLMDARRKRCIVVQGPAGIGKTTVMAAWRQALLPLDFDVGWLTATSDDNDVTRWLDYLLASVATVDPSLVTEAAKLSGRGSDSEVVERAIIALIRGIGARGRDLVLILDDLHLISNTVVRDGLQFLLDYAPDNLHLALVSRSPVPLSLARLRDQGLTLELDLQALRFSLDETGQFLNALLGGIDRREAQRLHERTDGWVAGLQLLCLGRGTKSLAGGARTGPERVLDAQTFAEYFEREVLSLLSPAEIALLERISVCSRFTAPLCAALLDPAGSLAEVAKLLGQLERDNVFILPVGGAERERWYRLHPLLSETLRQRLAGRGAEVAVAVHAAAWTWFRDQGLLDEAVGHAVLAGEEEAAADLLESCAPDLFVRGELRKLIGLVRTLPIEQVRKRIGLRLWLARSRLYARELDACAADIERLKQDVPVERKSTRFTLTLLQATLAVQRDNTDDAALLLPDLLEPPASAEATAIGGRNNILSWLYMHRGEFARAREVQLDTSKVAIDGIPLLGTAAGILQGRCLVGLSHAMEGHVTLAERVYRDVLLQAEAAGAAGVDPAYLATALLAEVIYETGDPNAALKLLEDRVDVLERVSIPDAVLRVMTVLSRSHWLLGRHHEGFAYLERLHEYASNLGLDRLLTYSLAGQINRHLDQGEFDTARELLKEVAAIAVRHADAGNSTHGEIALVAERAQIRWLLAMGNLEEAATRIAPLIDRSEAMGRLRMVAWLKLQSALINRRLQQHKLVHKELAEALRYGQRLGLVRSLIDVDPQALVLINQFALESDPDPLLTFHIDRLNAAATSVAPATPAPAARASTYPALSEREADIVRLLAQAMPNKKIARTLSLSPETVKWHLKNVYGKLGVSSRDEAVARIRDLRLTSGGP